MSESPPKTPDSLSALAGPVQGSWPRFLDLYEPLRSDLYRYCRYLTRSPWDAEDLSQDALARTFATLGSLGEPPKSPRAWLFRIASNLWIDRLRSAREIAEVPTEQLFPTEPRATREASGTLITRLSPQERAAVVLKDVFDLSLGEIAEALETTSGAVKAALHRGREKLVAKEEPEAPRTTAQIPAPGVLDAFQAAFDARDLDKLTALLLDTAATEIVGVHTAYGPEAARAGALTGMLFGSGRMAAADQHGGIDATYTQGVLPTPPRIEVLELRGERVLVSFYAHVDGEAVRAITRLETEGDRIARIRNYFYTPELLADVCGELGLRYRTNGYRYWEPAREEVGK